MRKDFSFPTQWDVSIKGEETLKELFERIQDFLEEILKKYHDKTILIVSHGGAIIPIQCYFENLAPEERSQVEILKNCEILEYDKE